MDLRKIKFLRDIINDKYKNIVFNNNEYRKRYELQMYLEHNKSKIYNQKYHICESCEFFYNDVVWNKKNLLSFYKKFNVHLKLKKKYDYNLKAQSKKNACVQTYLILLNKIYLSGMFNDLQKLNFVLKINDLIIAEFFQDYVNFHLMKKNNFEIERKIIRKVLS